VTGLSHSRPTRAVLIFFAHPMDTVPGFDGTYADVRPFADLKLVQMILEKQPK